MLEPSDVEIVSESEDDDSKEESVVESEGDVVKIIFWVKQFTNALFLCHSYCLSLGRVRL